MANLKIGYAVGYRRRFVSQFFESLTPIPKADPPSGTDRPLYAVVKLSDVCVYGTGLNPRDAAERAQKWIPGAAMAELPEFPSGGVCVARCTPRFAETVERRGGAAYLPVVLKDGMLDVDGTEPQPSAAVRRFEENKAYLDKQIAEMDGGGSDAGNGETEGGAR